MASVFTSSAKTKKGEVHHNTRNPEVVTNSTYIYLRYAIIFRALNNILINISSSEKCVGNNGEACHTLNIL